MLETEYIKSMNCNFERIHLEEKPEEKRYQYCILSRGGIRGLLPFSLRYINGDTYLYYDISSKQSMAQMFYNKTMDREWVKDFVWNLSRMQREISRFLLDERNLIWFPEQVYQDLDDNRWCFMYYPYYESDNGFSRFLEFVVSKIDHEDKLLVQCVYKMYEEYRQYGDAYLTDKIRQDVMMLDEKTKLHRNEFINNDGDIVNRPEPRYKYDTDLLEYVKKEEPKPDTDMDEEPENEVSKTDELKESSAESGDKKKKRGFLSFLDGSKKKDNDIREKSNENNVYLMGEPEVAMVAEPGAEFDSSDDVLEEKPQEYGRTVYVEAVAEKKDLAHRLFAGDGSVLAVLNENPVVIGKKKYEADIIIDNSTISRVHARITYVDGSHMLEDLNSTNGTFKNGLRLRPYERRKLLEGDEIKLGSINIMYK